MARQAKVNSPKAKSLRAKLSVRAESYAALVRERLSDQQYENTVRKELLDDMIANGIDNIPLPDGRRLEVVTTYKLKITK